MELVSNNSSNQEVDHLTVKRFKSQLLMNVTQNNIKNLFMILQLSRFRQIHSMQTLAAQSIVLRRRRTNALGNFSPQPVKSKKIARNI